MINKVGGTMLNGEKHTTFNVETKLFAIRHLFSIEAQRSSYTFMSARTRYVVGRGYSTQNIEWEQYRPVPREPFRKHL